MTKPDLPRKQFPSYHAVNDRPMKIVEGPGGFLEARVIDWRTGGFVVNDAYFEQIFVTPFKDVDSFTKFEFDLRVRLLRAPIVDRLLATPMVWAHTGDGLVPYTTTNDDRIFRIRINDFPEEPLYTLMFDGEEITDLEDWPEQWTRPGTPQVLLDKLGIAKRNGDDEP